MIEVGIEHYIPLSSFTVSVINKYNYCNIADNNSLINVILEPNLA